MCEKNEIFGATFSAIQEFHNVVIIIISFISVVEKTSTVNEIFWHKNIKNIITAIQKASIYLQQMEIDARTLVQSAKMCCAQILPVLTSLDRAGYFLSPFTLVIFATISENIINFLSYAFKETYICPGNLGKTLRCNPLPFLTVTKIAAK